MYVTQISLDRQLAWGIFKSCRYRQRLFPGSFLAGLVLPSNLVTYLIQTWSWGLLPAVHAIQQRCHWLTGERMLPSECAISGITDSGQLHSPIAILYSSWKALAFLPWVQIWCTYTLAIYIHIHILHSRLHCCWGIGKCGLAQQPGTASMQWGIVKRGLHRPRSTASRKRCYEHVLGLSMELQWYRIGITTALQH